MLSIVSCLSPYLGTHTLSVTYPLPCSKELFVSHLFWIVGNTKHTAQEEAILWDCGKKEIIVTESQTEESAGLTAVSILQLPETQPSIEIHHLNQQVCLFS